jgi:hypothetical protein
MAAPDYDVMEDEAEEEETEEIESEDPADDDEFMLAAEEAGFTGDKAKALWRAIQRCNELGPAPMAMDEEEELPL